MRKIGWLVVFVSVLTMAQLSAAQTDQPCSGFQTRLGIGMMARVTPGDPNNMRSAAGTANALVGQIPGGASFQVIAGPRCVDGYTWWQVDYSAQRGWTPEASRDGAYWLEPLSTSPFLSVTPTAVIERPEVIGGTGGGGVAGGVGGSGRAGVMPADLLAGITFYAGGGGGVSVSACTDINSDGTELVPLLNDGVTGYKIYEPNAPIPSGTTIRGLFDGGGKTPDVVSPFFSAYYAPAICAARNLSPDEVIITPPADYLGAEVFEAAVFTYFSGDFSEIYLPVRAYTIPGIWSLEVDGYVMNFEVTRPDEPVHVGYALLGDIVELHAEKNAFALIGYQPNDQIALLEQEGSIIYVQTDENGNAIAFPPSYPLPWAAIPESGENMSLGSPFAIYTADGYTVWYLIPDEITIQALYGLIWQGESVQLDGWNCPDAPPIRLMDLGNARPTTSAVTMYSEPRFDAPIVRVIGQNEMLIVFGSPIACSESTIWWAIKHWDEELYEYVLDGWIPESVDGEYVVAPA